MGSEQEEAREAGPGELLGHFDRQMHELLGFVRKAPHPIPASREEFDDRIDGCWRRLDTLAWKLGRHCALMGWDTLGAILDDLHVHLADGRPGHDLNPDLYRRAELAAQRMRAKLEAGTPTDAPAIGAIEAKSLRTEIAWVGEIQRKLPGPPKSLNPGGRPRKNAGRDAEILRRWNEDPRATWPSVAAAMTKAGTWGRVSKDAVKSVLYRSKTAGLDVREARK